MKKAILQQNEQKSGNKNYWGYESYLKRQLKKQEKFKLKEKTFLSEVTAINKELLNLKNVKDEVYSELNGNQDKLLRDYYDLKIKVVELLVKFRGLEEKAYKDGLLDYSFYYKIIKRTARNFMSFSDILPEDSMLKVYAK